MEKGKKKHKTIIVMTTCDICCNDGLFGDGETKKLLNGTYG